MVTARYERSGLDNSKLSNEKLSNEKMERYKRTVVRVDPKYIQELNEWIIKHTYRDSDFISEAIRSYPKEACFDIKRYASYGTKNFYQLYANFKVMTSEDFLKAEGVIETELIW